MPIGTSLLKAAETAQYIGCNAMQMFASNPTAWTPTSGGESACIAFAEAARIRDLVPVVLHAPYLINLAAPEKANREKSIALLRWTLQRAVPLGASAVVLHPGSHKGTGVEAGVQQVAEALAHILPATPPEVLLLLENSVGAGHTLGGEVRELAAILQRLSAYSERLGVCLDTAHLWGAGHDISTHEAALQVLQQFDELIGLQRLQVLHLNDTEKTLGSRRDVHTRIGEGVIGEEGLRTLLCDPRLTQTIVLLETPIKTNEQGKEDWEHDKAHLQRVRALMQPAQSISL
jgi:deoxyribonuclease-4